MGMWLDEYDDDISGSDTEVVNATFNDGEYEESGEYFEGGYGEEWEEDFDDADGEPEPEDGDKEDVVGEPPLDGAEKHAARQGLTLVHFSAQLEPFLIQTHTLNTS